MFSHKDTTSVVFILAETRILFRGILTKSVGNQVNICIIQLEKALDWEQWEVGNNVTR